MTDPSVLEWERAFARFESPSKELAKFSRRLRRLGVTRWPRSLRVLELICGRGRGITAWKRLGFDHVVGLDISERLLRQHETDAWRIAADACDLPLADASFDVVCVQGGLHHLTVGQQLPRCLDHVARVLRPGGTFIVIEPWMTPFLAFVHGLTRRRWLRAAWPRLDALAVMIEHERETYEPWLASPEPIMRAITERFGIQRRRIGAGKLTLLARVAGQSEPAGAVGDIAGVLRCPATGQPLARDGDGLTTPDGARRYPVQGTLVQMLV